MRISVVFPVLALAALAAAPLTRRVEAQATAASPGVTLDYEYFKAKVQPILLAKRPGHARSLLLAERDRVPVGHPSARR